MTDVYTVSKEIHFCVAMAMSSSFSLTYPECSLAVHGFPPPSPWTTDSDHFSCQLQSVWKGGVEVRADLHYENSSRPLYFFAFTGKC